MTPPTSWAVTPAGLSVYVGGALVAVVPLDQAGALVFALLREMRDAGRV